MTITTYHLPIRFGYSTRRDLSTTGMEVASAVASAFFGDPQPQSLPIEWISTNFRLAAPALCDILEKAAGTIVHSQNLLIEVGGSAYFDPIDPEVHYGLLKFLSGPIGQHPHSVLIVCPGRLAAGSPETAAYKSIVEIANRTMVFVHGNDLEPAQIETDDPIVQAVHAVRDIYVKRDDDVRSRFERTVLRRPGFSREQRSTNIAFTYDFSNGSPLALELCRKQVIAIGSRGITTVVYRADRSWFATVVEDACFLAGTEVTAHALAAGQRVVDLDLGDREYALFSPVVRSGSQFDGLLSGTDRAPSNLWCLGSIDEGNCQYLEERVRKLSVSRPDGSLWHLELHFEVSVNSSPGFVSRLWSALGEGLDTATFATPKYPLSAPAAWAMMLEADFGQEGYGPERDRLALAPNFSGLVENNAAFLAQTFRDEIKRTINRPFSQGDLILCADEPAARKLAAEIVGSVYEKSILVSRQLIDFIKMIGHAETDARRPDLLDEEVVKLTEQVREAKAVLGLKGSRLVSAIVLDEMIVSGATLVGLSQLAKIIGLDIQAAVSILQLCEIAPTFTFPLRALYRIPTPDYLWRKA
ncbi:hypothetical protein [Mesorhizobium sp.]|uniref:hypothetical protein n=1 Tax=Mesorhizobium sp. TaxID=1871066 RepID=UPI001221FBF7|nr:hypothetical protein [Mesorhizobium sp.]TIV60721.1 MAG: hypothetical protein E5V80_07955 [Mesorhizobium sp.]